MTTERPTSTGSPSALLGSAQAPLGRQHLAEMLRDVVRGVEGRFASAEFAVTGVADIDRHLVPLDAGTVLVLSSDHPVDGMTFVLQSALAAASRGHHVSIVAPPGTSRSLAHRLLVLASGVNGATVVRGQLTERDWRLLGRALGQLEELSIVAVETRLAPDDLSRVLAELPVGAGARAPVVVLLGVSAGLGAEETLVDLVRCGELGWHRAWMIAPTSESRVDVSDRCDVDVCTVHLSREDDEPVARVDPPYGTGVRVPLFQPAVGGRLFGRSDLDAEDRSALASASSPAALDDADGLGGI